MREIRKLAVGGSNRLLAWPDAEPSNRRLPLAAVKVEWTSEAPRMNGWRAALIGQKA